MSENPIVEYPKYVGDRKNGTRTVVNNKEEEAEFYKANPPKADEKKPATPGW